MRLTLSMLLATVVPTLALAQPTVLPLHEPINPAVVARSALQHLPIERAAPGWRLALTSEYGSAVEQNLNWPDAYLYDAELLRVQATLRRDLGTRGFVRLQAGVTGAYAGFADAFFEEYHQLIQWTMPERDTRPRNVYGSRLLLRDAALDRRGEGHALLPADVRATVGLRVAEGQQTALTLTLPTAPGGSVYARGVPALAVLHTAQTSAGRVRLEGSVGLGYAPVTGELRDVQRTLLTSAAGGLRLQLAARHALYGALFHHSAPYRGTGFPELDDAELSADFGYVWTSRSGRQWRLGLTEDVRRRDPGIDLVVKLAVE